MLVDIEKIIVDDRIRKDYGDLQELADDISENGLINAVLVTPDLHLIAGERRYRAIRNILGWKQIEVRPMTVRDALHQLKLEISENENRKEFTFSERMKWADQLKEEYRKIAEVNSAANGFGDTTDTSVSLVGRVDEHVAEEVGIGSREKLRKAEYIQANASEEMIRQLDDGQLSINAAYVKLKNELKENEVKAKELADLKAKQDAEVSALRKSVRQKEEMIIEVQSKVDLLESVPASSDPELIAERDKYLQEKRTEYEKRQVAEKEKREAEQRANTLEKEVSDLGRKLEKYVQLAEREPEIQTVEVEPKDYLKIKQELAASKEKIKNMEFINKHKDDLGVDGAHNAKYLLDTLAELNARLGACQYGDYINSPGNDQATINAALDQILEAQKLLQLISKKVEAEVA